MDSRAAKWLSGLNHLLCKFTSLQPTVEGSSPVPQSCPQTSTHHTHINVDSNVSRESTFGLPVLLAAIHIRVTYSRSNAKPDDQSENAWYSGTELKSTFVSGVSSQDVSYRQQGNSKPLLSVLTRKQQPMLFQDVVYAGGTGNFKWEALWVCHRRPSSSAFSFRKETETRWEQLTCLKSYMR